MNTRRAIVIGGAACILLFSLSGQTNWWPFSNKQKDEAQTAEMITVGWGDLIPEDFVQPENPFISMSQDEIDKLLDGSAESEARLKQLQAEFNYAPVVDKLDGMRVKIAAYVTPLEFDGQTRMREFLLVPYVGACMHTPPPPANQIVHAISEEIVEIPGIYDPIWAIGTLRTETVKSDLAESGYRLDVDTVLPYTQP